MPHKELKYHDLTMLREDLLGVMLIQNLNGWPKNLIEYLSMRHVLVSERGEETRIYDKG